MPVDINFVAHQDDDALFMQPDIINSYLKESVAQVTVYLTCGNDEQWDDLVYIRRREQGAMDAFAQMGQIKAGQMGRNAGYVRWMLKQKNYGPVVATVADCLDFSDLGAAHGPRCAKAESQIGKGGHRQTETGQAFFGTAF
jgi:hypothetical protein